LELAEREGGLPVMLESRLSERKFYGRNGFKLRYLVRVGKKGRKANVFAYLL